MAPREGFEPPTGRLTAACSTTELPRISAARKLATAAPDCKPPVRRAGQKSGPSPQPAFPQSFPMLSRRGRSRRMKMDRAELEAFPDAEIGRASCRERECKNGE